MPSLQVRDLPENIYQLLQEKAKLGHRSLAQEAIITLAAGLKTCPSGKSRRLKILKSISENSRPPEIVLSIDPVTLIREDRQR